MSPGNPALPAEAARWSVDELIPFGKYVLLNKISAGATAAVYRAKVRGEAGFERLLTIKRILPQMAGDQDFVETFVQEAKICARLNHSSICPIYELGKVGESLYLAMEWVSGKDLGAVARRLEYTGKVMPPMIAAWIASRLCDALDYAHALKDASGKTIGIVHQDLSPANIVISYEGQVKLIDFGLAKAAGRAQQTNVDALKQKIGYMSPELVLGTTLDARSDVFGVGVCLYEMVTGRRLFAGPDDIATLKLVSSANVPPPSALVEDTPDDLEMIMMRALERDPDDRWDTAGEMGQALAACIANDDPTFGTRHIAEFMRELFSQDMAAEQRRLNDLLSASKDPAVIEERRRFFTSPLGAAAIAKAEASRRVLSTLPPPPKSAGAPYDPLTPIDRDSQPALAASSEQATEQTDDELTTFRPERTEGGPGEASKTSQDDEDDELTTFRPERTEGGPGEDEPTAFHEAADALAKATARTPAPDSPQATEARERSTIPPGPTERENAPEYDPARDAAFVTVRETRVGKHKQSTSAHGFEDEATSYFDSNKRESRSRDGSDPHGSMTTVTSSLGPFGGEEEATHIFFSQDEGIGLADLVSEPPSRPAPPNERPLPPMAAGLEAPPPRGRTTSEMRAKTSPGLRTPSRDASASGSRRPLPLEPIARKGRFTPAWPVKIGEIDRGATLELSSARRNERGPLLFVGIAMLAFTILGVVVKTEVGVKLGLRKPTDGAIEVRTVPPVPAAVRLDGIYRGRAPLRLEGVRAGERMLALEADGFITVARHVTVEGGGTASINIALEAQPAASP